MSLAGETSGSTEGTGILLREMLLQSALRSHTSPLSFPQRRLWFLHQMGPDNPRYNMASVARLTGDLDFRALTEALNSMVARHESLRTHFAVDEGEPVKIIEQEARIEIGTKDLAVVPAAERERALELAIREEIN